MYIPLFSTKIRTHIGLNSLTWKAATLMAVLLMEAAQEALSAYLLTLLEQKQAIASPSDISAIHADDGFSSLVSCDINQYRDTKAVKKTLTIPAWLNDRAISMGLNFSQVLQEALLSKIQA